VYWDIFQVSAYKGIIADQTPPSNPNFLLTGRLIVFSPTCENSQLVTKIAIERGLKVLRSIVYPCLISILLGTTVILLLGEPS
jgi:hypothetical protein